MANPTHDINELKRRMQGAIQLLKQELGGLRTGRASASLVEPIQVEAYGTHMPLNQVASVSVPEPRLIFIQVWDRAMVHAVEKAIAASNLGLTPQTLIASPTSGIGSVKELIEKAKGGDLNYGSSGNGSASHLAVALTLYAAGIRMTHIPFKGNAEAQMALQNGDIQLMSDAVPAIVAPILGGRVKAVGVCDSKRSPYLPDVPTVAEQGYPSVLAVGSIGIGAPANTPAPILDKLATEVDRLLAEPVVIEKLKSLFFVPAPERRGQYGKFIADEIDRWRTVVKAADIKID